MLSKSLSSRRTRLTACCTTSTLAVWFSNDKIIQYRWLMVNSGFNVSRSLNEQLDPIASIAIWRVGDFFGIEDFCKLALDGFNEELRKASWLFAAKESLEDFNHSANNCVQLIQALYNQEKGDGFEASGGSKSKRPSIFVGNVSRCNALRTRMKRAARAPRERVIVDPKQPSEGSSAMMAEFWAILGKENVIVA